MHHKNIQREIAKTLKSTPVIQALQLTALFAGGAIWQQKQTDILCEWVALAEFRLRRLGKHFCGTKRL
jgi:hypothetical protein